MPIKIAVVDDNATALDWLRDVLESNGFAVVTYGQSFGIQAFIRQEKPAALILDVNMPALSGNVICGLLKENPDTKSLIIVLYSAMPVSQLKEAAARCGADGYLPKTNDGKRLVSELRLLLSRSVDVG